MKRRYFVVELLRDATTLDMADACAMNSGIRASEGLVRARARALGCVFEGDKPDRRGAVYTRLWRGTNGEVLTARVEEVPA